MIFITAIKKLRQKAESLPPIHTQIMTQRKGKLQMLPLLHKASIATKFNWLCISTVSRAMPVMLTIISKCCWAVPWHPWHPLPCHTQLVNCSRDLHPTRSQRKHQHPPQSTVPDAAVLKKKLQIKSTLAYQYTALSFSINKVDYKEALIICNIISCYKTLNILLRIYHDF